ncbi:MAG TPA: phospholipid carrier-dependent glycosyltransferase, partial [Anaerolineae bacterium]|nr:phospholipid carrier-dependent glycosyltransferase [Anaerolineae bacterium]
MDEAGQRGWREALALARAQIENFTRQPHFVPLLLGLILIVGAYFRFVGLNWDADQHLHPDERFLTMVETSIALPRSLGEYFNSAISPLNPYNRGHSLFVYGTLPLFLTRIAGQMVHKTEYWNIHLVGRALSALFDLGSVVLIFLIGRKLYDRRVGLLSAALLAMAVFPIQQSHFFAVDTFANFFVVAALYFAILVAREGRWWAYGLLGASFGMAIACKINLVTLAAIVVLAAAVHLYITLRKGAPAEDAFAVERTA